ncbi:MAG: aminotransferase class V-fold PLP-dependent enzyme [Actinomycetota bacterium]|nr:aminotransferase class V-fold PLP-dependent enzyme [Actinomycetota bacterium]
MAVSDAYLHEFSEPVGYLDFAGIGPPSRRVRAAVADGYARVSEPDTDLGPSILGGYEAGLGTVGRFLGVAPELATVVPSTSTGLFRIAFGLAPFGGNIVVPAHEFPANIYPWLRAAGMGGPEVRLVDVPDRRVTAGVLSDAVDDETRAIAVSSVDYLSGFRPDLSALRELADDGLLVVDAIQGLGAIEFSAAPADVVVAGGQKWLRAGWGTGLLALSHRSIEMLHPTLTGWWGVEDSFDWDTLPPHKARTDAEVFQDGSPPLFGAMALAAALEVIEAEGMPTIHQAVMDNVKALEEVVRTAGAEILEPWDDDDERSGILSFRLDGEENVVTAQRLADAGISVSSHSNWVRLAPHASTDLAVAEILAEVLDSDG